ncbi:hypothetical protein BDB01DRAFT_788990 [Pilobolus umbonatus]|nr:hypothetical protein BDB01DRAFT_788990 [Pilobolus umbonatus]
MRILSVYHSKTLFMFLIRRSIHRRLLHTHNRLTPLTGSTEGFIRNHNYGNVSTRDVDFFRTVVGENNVIYDITNDSNDMLPYNTDWFKLYRGYSSLCLFPTTTKQISEILKHCNQNELAVVPQGGNTGVSGGAVPVHDEIVINLSKMNKIRHFDSISGSVIVDAGVILENLDRYLEERNFTVPLDLGAKGSCQIGGNVSTNAGGLRLMKFGNLHGNVLGLEVVLPNGQILNTLSGLRKDNTGYDLKQLFIGAEGTLGIVTAVSLVTPRKPKSVNVAMLALDSFEAVQNAFIAAKDDLSEILSAFEFWDVDSVDVVKSEMKQDSSYPINGRYPFYVLLETQGSKQDHDQEKLDLYLNNLMELGIAQDGVIAQDAKQMTSLWSWREKIPEAVAKYGTAVTYDFSMEVPLLYKMVEDAREYFKGKNALGVEKTYTNLLGFGHVGDGNLHLMANLNGPGNRGKKDLDEFVFDWAIKHKSSISAEHGIGISKVNYMNRVKTDEELRLMRLIKKAIDPSAIMNPYKVIPDEVKYSDQ